MLVSIIVECFRRVVLLGWIFPVLVALELALPKGSPPPWLGRLKGVSFAAVYTLITAILMPVGGALLARLGVRPLFSAHLPSGSLRVPAIVAATAAYALMYDFLYYWFHRLQHTPVLWRFHAVHHSLRDMDAINAWGHWTEEVMRLPFIIVPWTMLFPAGLEPAAWGTNFIALQSYFLHSKTRVHWGPLWRLFYDPRFHRIHHGVELEHHDKNFGVVTPLWDWLFGTLYVPMKGEWPEVGLADQPEAEGLGDYLWRPFLPSKSNWIATLVRRA